MPFFFILALLNNKFALNDPRGFLLLAIRLQGCVKPAHAAKIYSLVSS